MQHFYQNIHGWPNQLPILYANVVNNTANSPAHFVEIGSFKGASSAAMCVEIINSGKNIKFDCVDLWGESHPELTEHLNTTWPDNALYKEFMANMMPVTGHFNPIQMDSLRAAELYEDGSLDFVCIDASHTYENVLADIKAWLPKVKSGGILAGDDFQYPPVADAVRELIPNVEHWEAAWFYSKP